MDRVVREPVLSQEAVRILALHASGYQLKEIAGIIYYSYPYTTGVVGEAKRQLGTRTLAQTVLRAHQLGYLSHPTGPDATVFPA